MKKTEPEKVAINASVPLKTANAFVLLNLGKIWGNNRSYTIHDMCTCFQISTKMLHSISITRWQRSKVENWVRIVHLLTPTC